MLLDCPDDAIFENDPHDHFSEFLLRVVVGGALTVFMAVAGWLLCRQFVGAFQPLTSALALAVGFGGASMVGLCRWGEWRYQRFSPESISLFNILFTIAIVVFAMAVSFPRVAPFATLLLWLPVVGEETAWWIFLYQYFARAAITQPLIRGSYSLIRTQPVSNPTKTLQDQRQLDAEPEEEVEGEEEPELLRACVTQQLTRELTTEQGEYLYGLLRCKLEKGEQSQNVHVAFCPPLNSLPEVVVRQLEGPDAMIKIGTAQTFGARFELRLSAIAKADTDVILQFEARTT